MPATFRPNWIPTKKENAALYDRYARDQIGIKFYRSTAWKKLRAVQLHRFPLCADCQRIGKVTPATDVHHIQPRDEYPHLALRLDNLESSCKTCHNKKRRKQHYNKG